MTYQPTRLINNYHSFSYIIDLNSIENIIQETTGNLLGFSHKCANHSDERLFHLSGLTHSKFLNFQPFNRNRRGLINAVGKIDKFLFGTADADDLEDIYSKLNTLARNEHSIATQVNLRTSLYTQLMDKMNKTFEIIETNEKAIMHHFNATLNQLNDLGRNMYCQGLANQISQNFLIILNHLQNLENALVNSYSGIIHHFFMSHSDLLHILETLTKLYDTRNLLKLETDEYYRLFHIRTKVKRNLIYIQLTVPLFDIRDFQLVYLIPIPFNNTILIPPKPYLVTSIDHTAHLWKDTTCRTIN